MNADIRKQISEQHSFNELALSYVAKHAANMSETQLQRHLAHLGTYLLGFFGAYALSDISPAKLQKFTYYLEAKSLKPKEIQSCLVSFRLCVRHAIHKGWEINPILLNPVMLDQDIEPPAQQLSQQEYGHLYQELLQDMTSAMFH